MANNFHVVSVVTEDGASNNVKVSTGKIMTVGDVIRKAGVQANFNRLDITCDGKTLPVDAEITGSCKIVVMGHSSNG